MDPQVAGAAAAPDFPKTDKTFCPKPSRRFVLIAAVLASSMGFIDGSVVALAMPSIRADLGASLVDAQWINNAYMLFLSALVLTGGAAGDVLGVRNIFAFAIAAFVATSLACAAAPDPASLIVMRAAQGAAAAFMVPASLAIIAKSYPVQERGRAIGIWAAASAMTTAFGPFIGGLVLSFGDDWMWRLIFAINGPIGLVAVALLLLRVPADQPGKGRRLDLPGAVLATLSLGTLAWGLTAFGVQAEMRMAPPLAWIGAAIIIATLLIFWERRSPQPMMKLDLFTSRAFSGANLYTLIQFLGFTAILFFLPMTLISAWGAPEWEASLALLPLALSIGLLSGAAGRFADRYGPRLPLTIGAILCAISYAGIGLTAPMMKLWSVTFPFLILNGIGMAILVSPLSAAVMLAAPDEDAGFASGFNNAVARAAGLISVAALGALASIVFGAAMGPQAGGLEFGALPQTGGTPQMHDLRISASNQTFAVIALASSLMSLAAALVSWTTQPSWRPAEAPAG
jgi:EmrB/QacA subfamily drug resistance transporter